MPASSSTRFHGGENDIENARASVPQLMQVTWQMTEACDWRATPRRGARKSTLRERVSTAEAFHWIEQVADMHVPMLALTGGDPLLRPDLFPIIEFAAHHSVRTSLTLLPTPQLNLELVADLKAVGLMRVGLWLHGSTPSLHDAYWGVSGSYRRTLDIVGACHEAQLPVHVNTIMARRNLHDVDPMIELLTRLDVAAWNVFFLVPSDRSGMNQMIGAPEHESVFAKLYAASQQAPFHIRTSEAPHYYRFVLQQLARESHGRVSEVDAMKTADSRGNQNARTLFIHHTGEAFPSRFLPLSGGNLTIQPLSDIYSHSTLFTSLRDGSRLKGKCGRCRARDLCGGSRARAYAVTGDLFASDPACAYEP